jgi:CheY-like chemotaxis protein
MPGLDGFDVLRWIRQEPVLSALRVVVLTASDDMRDVNVAYKMGANSFLIKPADLDRFVEISQALNGYWLWMNKALEGTNELPVAASLPDAELRKPFRRP